MRFFAGAAPARAGKKPFRRSEIPEPVQMRVQLQSGNVLATVCALILLAGWAAWSVPFIIAKRQPASAVKVDRRARWGIALQAVGYSLL